MKNLVHFHMPIIALFSTMAFILKDANVLAKTSQEQSGKFMLVKTPDREKLPDFLVVEKQGGRKSLIKVDTKPENEQIHQKHRGQELINEGLDCLNSCSYVQGPCAWCGTKEYCCRSGWSDTSNGCDGTFGGADKHECVLKPEDLGPFEPVSRDFKDQMVAFDVRDFPYCKNQKIIQMKSYWMKREVKTKENQQEYTYYIEEAPGYDRVSFVYGTKEGTCRVGLTIREENQECGFQEQLLTQCILDRTKSKKNPLKKPGFDPTRKGEYQWKNQAIAKTAEKHCEVLIHVQLGNEKWTTAEELTNALLHISYVMETAKTIKVGKKLDKKFNMIFMEKQPKQNQMVISNLNIFEILFQKNNPEFEKKAGNFRSLVSQILPDMFFCACDGKPQCGEMVGKSDSEIYKLIQQIIRPSSR